MNFPIYLNIYIKSALMRLQNNCVHTRKDIDDVENGVAIKA